MKIIVLTYSKLLIMFCLAFTDLFGQNLEETKKMADQFWSDHDYENAVITYRRYLFFGGDMSSSVFSRVSSGYEKMGEYEKAIYYNNLAFEIEKDPIQAEEKQLRTTFLYLMKEEYLMADLWLSNIDQSVQTPEKRKELFLYKGVAHYKNNKFETSAGYFLKYSPQDSIKISGLFDELYLSEKRNNPKRARILSIILPGLGQFSTGHIKEGVNSLTINGAMVFLFARVVSRTTFLDAVLSIAPWQQRFYAGGFNAAALLAEKKRDRIRQEIYEALIRQLIE